MFGDSLESASKRKIESNKFDVFQVQLKTKNVSGVACCIIASCTTLLTCLISSTSHCGHNTGNPNVIIMGISVTFYDYSSLMLVEPIKKTFIGYMLLVP